MNQFNLKEIQNIAEFNPTEKIPKGVVAKSVPMAMLKEFQRQIVGYEINQFSSGSKFRNGDVLLAKITPCLENGKTAFVDILDANEVAFGSTEFIVLRAKEETDPEFLYYFARSPAFRKRAIECMEGTSGRQRVNENTLKMLELPIPDLPTQKSIASILSALDRKIALNNQINQTLEQMAKTLYDYWFVQFDFPDEHGKPYRINGGAMVYNETLKREIPVGWEVKTLGEIATVKKGTLITEKTANTNGKIKVVSAGIDFSYFHDESNYPENTITLSASGANAGFINFWREPIFACDCTTVTTNDIGKTLYIFNFLYQTQEFIYQQARGSAQPHVYPKDIEALKLVMPSENILNKFKQMLESNNTQIACNEKQNAQLTQLRDFLLPMLINGQVSVQDFQAA